MDEPAQQRAPALGKAARDYARLRFVPILISGAYAWLLTVAPLGVESDWHGAAALPILLSPLTLLAALLVPSPKWALYCCLHGFLGCCLLSLVLAPARTLPIEREYGFLSWLAYTVALGVLSTPKPNPVADGEARGPVAPSEPFLPRVRPSKGALWSVLIGAGGALALYLLALRIERPELSVLAQLSALGIGLLLLGGSVALAESLQHGLARTRFHPRGGQVLLLGATLFGLLSWGLASGFLAR